MIINFSPVRMDEELLVDVEGDIIMVNGVEFDFSPLPEGATLPSDAINSDWFVNEVTRVDGQLIVTLKLPHGPNAPESTRFSQPFVVTEDGSVDIPIHDAPEEQVEVEV